MEAVLLQSLSTNLMIHRPSACAPLGSALDGGEKIGTGMDVTFVRRQVHEISPAQLVRKDRDAKTAEGERLMRTFLIGAITYVIDLKMEV